MRDAVACFTLTALLAILFLLAGCSKRNGCEGFAVRRAVGYEACLHEERCLLSGEEMQVVVWYKREYPHCFKEESR